MPGHVGQLQHQLDLSRLSSCLSMEVQFHDSTANHYIWRSAMNDLVDYIPQAQGLLGVIAFQETGAIHGR
jgi:hypothetical protein